MLYLTYRYCLIINFEKGNLRFFRIIEKHIFLLAQESLSLQIISENQSTLLMNCQGKQKFRVVIEGINTI